MTSSRARRLVSRLRERRRIRRESKLQRIRSGRRIPRRKRKLALAASVSALTLNTGAIGIGTAANQVSETVQRVNPSEVRVSSDYLSVSDAMKEAMIEEEGVRYTVYRDVAGYPTVGVGHLVTSSDNLRVGERISEERALDLFEQDLEWAEGVVHRLVGDLPLYQHEFDALVDLAFNVGEGNLSERKSPALNAAIDARDYEGIAAELAYHHAAGSEAKGLVYRSDRRQNVFIEAEYTDPRDLPEIRA